MTDRVPQLNTGAPLLGCIADDVTGATDLSLNLVQGGMRVVQWLDPPTADEMRNAEADAVVIALKSRSVKAAQAIDMSLKALEGLQAAGCRRFYFKYCSTFDSTDEGNIGPVAEALSQSLSTGTTLFCPSFPETGRTVCHGHLFVNHALLNESGMQDHPLNPMRDANLVRVLGRQSRRKVGLVSYHDVENGPKAIASRLQELRDNNHPLVIVDTLGEHQLKNIAEACADAPLVTGGSGLARFLPASYRARRLLTAEPFTPSLPAVPGRGAILSGSCSQVTRAQVARQRERCAARHIDVTRLMQKPEEAYLELTGWIAQQPEHKPLMVYSTDGHESVESSQQQFGREEVARGIEQLHARVARSMVERFGVRRLIVAGGETSSAVAAGLEIKALRIGPPIAPGVPWTESLGERPLALAFKSGNFGDENFFQTALEMLA